MTGGRSGARSRVRTLTGLASVFRRWAEGAKVASTPEVPGTNDAERRLLAALGGIAASVGGERVDCWPEPIRRWATDAEAPPDELVDAVCTALGRRDDPLSVLYDASVSASNRRRLGTVFTPPALVDHMVLLAKQELGETPGRVVDPGAGVGAFTVAAARRWPGARIAAIDVNPVTLGLLATRIAFEVEAEPERATSLEAIDLVLDDYLEALPRLVSSDSNTRTLILGNPPYTRIQELPPSVRKRAAEMAVGVIDSGHANLAVLFQAVTLKRMRAHDVSCMVLPGSFSYTRASAGLRRTLWASRRRVAVERAPATTRAFAGRSVQAAVLLVGAERTHRMPLELARLTIHGDRLEATDRLTRSRRNEEPPNWFWAGASNVVDAAPLAEVAIVRRGVATGANEMFFLDDEEASRLPEQVRTAAIASLRGFVGLSLDEETHEAFGSRLGRRWLLAVPEDFHLDGDLEEYIAHYEDDVKGRHLPSRRDPWYSITDLPRPQLLVSPLSKTGFKIVANEVGAVPSNNLLGITMRNGDDPERLAAWLRSADGQRELRRVSRRYHGGSHKLEPGDLKAARVPKNLQIGG
ncbi:MAG: hypothetical protein R2718_04295 [Solirubrobacterales bacterium]